MSNSSYKLNSWFNKSTAQLILGATILASTSVHAFDNKSTSYDNSRYIIEKIKQTSGTTVVVNSRHRKSQISIIRDIFDIKNEELSETIGISRKTLHNWEKFGIKKEKDRQRVFELSVIAEDWKFNKLPTNKEALSKPIVGSLSVIDMLKDEKLDREKIIFAGRRLSHQSLAPEIGLI